MRKQESAARRKSLNTLRRAASVLGCKQNLEVNASKSCAGRRCFWSWVMSERSRIKKLLNNCFP